MPNAKLSSQVQINRDDLPEEMAKQPGLFSHYGELAAYAEHELREAKEELGVLEAQAYQEIDSHYRRCGQKVTVKQIEMEIVLDTRVQALKKKVSRLKLQRDLTRVAAESFQHRLQSLISLGKITIAEVSGLGMGGTREYLEEELNKRVAANMVTTPSTILFGKPRPSTSED